MCYIEGKSGGLVDFHFVPSKSGHVTAVFHLWVEINEHYWMSDGNSYSLIHKNTAGLVLKESIAVFVFGKLMVLLFMVIYFINVLISISMVVFYQ